jgi:hypothetical protein
LIVAFIFVLPVVYLAYESYDNYSVRWFNIIAQQDERTAEIAEQIQSNEAVGTAIAEIDEDTAEQERTCGMIAFFADLAYNFLLLPLADVIGPLRLALEELNEVSKTLLKNVRPSLGLFGNLDLNLPYNFYEFYVIFTLPLCFVLIIVFDIILTIVYMYRKNDAYLVVLNNVESVLVIISVASLQISLLIYGVFLSLAAVDVPLFKISVEMGKMIEYAIYSSILCLVAVASLWFNRLIPLY